MKTNGMIDCKGCGKQVHYTASACPNCGAINMFAPDRKNKLVAGLLAIFLGCWGAHKFYLGRPGLGILYILCTFPGIFLFGIPTIIIGIVSFIEGIVYLCSSEQAFSMKYDKMAGRFNPRFHPQSSAQTSSPQQIQSEQNSSSDGLIK